MTDGTVAGSGMRPRARSSGVSAADLVRRFSGLAVVAVIIVAWEAATIVLATPRYLVPAPTVILGAAIGDAPKLAGELGQTLVEALAGFALGSTTAILLAIGVQRSRTFELTALPPIMVLQSVPIVAVTPVIALIVGRNVTTAIIIAAIICFFPVTVNALRGLRSVSDETLELMHVLAAPGWRVLATLQLPASLPHLFGGLRVAATVCFPGAMIAEWLAADRGLGYYIIDMQVRFRTELVWAGILVATLTSVALFTIITIAERLLVGWHDDATEMARG